MYRRSENTARITLQRRSRYHNCIGLGLGQSLVRAASGGTRAYCEACDPSVRYEPLRPERRAVENENWSAFLDIQHLLAPLASRKCVVEQEKGAQ
jgi:hypothetical protein